MKNRKPTTLEQFFYPVKNMDWYTREDRIMQMVRIEEMLEQVYQPKTYWFIK